MFPILRATLLGLLQVILVQSVAFALPVLNTTASDVGTSSYDNGPPSCDNLYHCRSLLNIVWSCLTTIFLCTWVAVHPDVWHEDDSWMKNRFLDRLCYVALMLFFPELVAASAWDEWDNTGKLIKSLSGTCFSSLPCNVLYHATQNGIHIFDGQRRMGWRHAWVVLNL